MASSTGRTPRYSLQLDDPELLRTDIAKAATAAKSARTAVIFVWSLGGNNLVLPDEQDELIGRVAAANPRTLVVLNAGFAVKMPWKENVRAILDMWYPGQEGGEATANLLLGRVNPSGKLPFTFPRHSMTVPPMRLAIPSGLRNQAQVAAPLRATFRL